MAITSDEIKFRLNGGSANTTANSSLGGFMSLAASIADNSANNLWDDVAGAEAAAGDTEYRCFWIRNSNATLTLQSAVCWVSQTTPSPSTIIYFGFDAPDTGLVGNTYWCQSVADESTAPTGVSFVNSSTEATGISWGGTANLANCSVVGVWVKRVVGANAAAASNDYWGFEIKGDTAA